MKNQTLLFYVFLISVVFVYANPPKKTTAVKSKTTVKKTAPVKIVRPAVAVPVVSADAVTYDKSKTTEEFVSDGKDILISGNENTLTITGTVGKVLITGKNNDITIVAVNEIIVTGNGNFVSWEKTNNSNLKPLIQDKGGYNNIEKRSGNAQTKEEN